MLGGIMESQNIQASGNVVSEKTITVSSPEIINDNLIQQNRYDIGVLNTQEQVADKPYIEWCYDQEGFYSYVLINGDSNQKDYVVKRLEEHNIKSIRTGISYKIADNGKKYDWFLRVLYIPNNSVGIAVVPPTRDQINEVFSKYFTLHKDKYGELEYRYNELELEYAKSQKENERLLYKIDMLEKKLYYKQKKLSSKIDSYKILENNSTKTARALTFENHKLQNDIKALNDQLFILRSSLDNNIDFDNKIELLYDNIKNKDQEIGEWEKENDGLRMECENLKLENTLLENEKAAAQYEKDKIIAKLNEIESSKIGSLDNKKSIDVRSAFKNENAFGKLVETIFDKLIFIRGSVSYLFNEVQNPLPALELLKKLNYYPEKVESKRVKCAERWKEMHFSVGVNGNSGRLYYANDKSGEAKYKVVISDKETQKTDFDILKKS
jgi:hypothetical protein